MSATAGGVMVGRAFVPLTGRRAPAVRSHATGERWGRDVLEAFAWAVEREGAAALAWGFGAWAASDWERAAMYRAAAEHGGPACRRCSCRDGTTSPLDGRTDCRCPDNGVHAHAHAPGRWGP